MNLVGTAGRLRPGLQTLGSWRASSLVKSCIGTMNPLIVLRFSLSSSGGEGRGEEAFSLPGSWRASSVGQPSIGTMNLAGTLGRLKPGLQTRDSWKDSNLPAMHPRISTDQHGDVGIERPRV